MCKPYIYFRALLVFAAVFAGSAAYAQNSVSDAEYTPSPSGWGYSQYVAPPALPEYLDFAGEPVPLDNYDTRESLQREMLVNLYTHSRAQLTLLNMKRYFAIIVPILRRNDIPEDFKYLCAAESGLNPEAISGSGAAGLWQIMPGTAGDFGLETGGEVDERYHIEKATEVVCLYLQRAYKRLGSWTLVAAAYNLGIDGVAKRITRQGVYNYYDAFMPLQTMRYVFIILSWKIIMENPAAYGYHIKEKDYYPPLTNYVEQEVSDSPAEWSQVAARYGTNYKILRQLNPWIRDYEYANKKGKTMTVKVPAQQFRQQTEKQAAE